MNTTDLLKKADSGDRLTPTEGLYLYQEADPRQWMPIAHELRLQRTEPGRVTYLVDRNINYTNACTTDCQFCSFYRVPGHPEVYVISRRELGEKIEELLAWGGTRILMQGGHNPDLRIEWYEDILRWLKATYPEIELDCFSPSEMENIAQLEGMTMEAVLERLNQAGLDGLPGGGAEILDDAVRARISPKKTKTAEWLHAMRIAQRLGMVTSATMVIGFGESMEQRVTSLTRLRELQDESLAAHGNGFTAFIMWTAQLSETNSMGRSRHRTKYGADYDEYLHTNAFARIYLDNFTNFQASWPTQGLETAQKALHAGANDFGSTMLEENVVSQAAAFTECEPAMTVYRLHEQIRQAGFAPAQRDSRYNIVRDFDRVMRKEELAPVSIPTRLNRLSDDPDILPEYDFSDGLRGKDASTFREGYAVNVYQTGETLELIPNIAIKPELYKQVEEAALELDSSVDEFLAEAARRFLWEIAREKIAAESKIYRQQHADLKTRYAGEYIAMHKGEVVDHDVDKDALWQRIRQRFGQTPVMITLVSEEPERTLVRRGFRFEEPLQ